MALDLGITPKTIAASEERKRIISQQRKLSQEEYIAQARRMLGRETLEQQKPKN